MRVRRRFGGPSLNELISNVVRLEFTIDRCLRCNHNLTAEKSKKRKVGVQCLLKIVDDNPNLISALIQSAPVIRRIV